MRPDAILARNVIEDASVAARFQTRLKSLGAPFVFEPQMVVGVFLVGDDVARRLGAVRRGILIHVNGPVPNLDEMIGIVASGISQDDVPAIEVDTVE